MAVGGDFALSREITSKCQSQGSVGRTGLALKGDASSLHLRLRYLAELDDFLVSLFLSKLYFHLCVSLA